MTGYDFMTQSSLFKGLSAIFGKYDSELIGRLLKKFEELGVEDYENTQASMFSKAIFFMQEDQKETKKSPPPSVKKTKPEEGLSTKEAKSSVGIGGSSMSPRKTALKNNRELQEDINAEKANFLGTKGTMGRGALREQNEYEKMFQMEVRDPSKLVQLDKIEVIRGRILVTRPCKT